MSTLRALQLEGHDHLAENRLDQAIGCFLKAVDQFEANRSADDASIEEFVKAAGTLCACYHTQGKYDLCFTTARELVDIYPVIPKAYAALGMSILDKVQIRHFDPNDSEASFSPRADFRNFLVTMGGTQCSVDDAHMYLCRAVLLSERELQDELAPWIATAVRLITQQVLVADYTLHTLYGEDLLAQLCPLEDTLTPLPLVSAPVMRQTTRLRMLDLPEVSGESTTSEEESGILSKLEGKDEARLSGERPPAHPVDYMLSGKPMSVRVCRAKEGGIPRGVTLVRAQHAFAVGTLHASPSHAMPLAAEEEPTRHTSGESPSCCVACQKRCLYTHTECRECGEALYCSPACEKGYRSRHTMYECALFQALTLHRRGAAESAADGKLDMGLFSLLVGVYSGWRGRSPGYEAVEARLEMGIQEDLLGSIPPPASRALTRLAECIGDDAPASLKHGTTPHTLLQHLFLLTRLYAERVEDSRAMFLFTEKLQFRHSCEPNCTWVNGACRAVTSRFIHNGEELTLALGEDAIEHMPVLSRDHQRREGLGFYCACIRCVRERMQVNTSRGGFSDDITERLLTGEKLARPTRVGVLAEPTTHFRLRITEALSGTPLGRAPSSSCAQQLLGIQKEAESHLLPTNYVFEMLRLLRILHSAEEDRDAKATRDVLDSLLFYESFWPGPTPAKLIILQMHPGKAQGSSQGARPVRRMRKPVRVNRSAGTEEGGLPVTVKIGGATTRSVVAPGSDLMNFFYESYRMWYV